MDPEDDAVLFYESIIRDNHKQMSSNKSFVLDTTGRNWPGSMIV